MKSYDTIIKNHYNKEGKKWGSSFKSTMEDVIVRKLETKFIIQMIRSLLNNHFSNIRAPKLIDVGCGNGYSLSIIKKKFKNLNLYGLEPNNKLRKLAKGRFNKKKVRVFRGDLRKIKISLRENFDILICQRVLINILNYSDQKKVLNNIKKLMKKNGILIFMESFEDGLRNLNIARKEFNLKPIEPSYHNLYLRRNFFKISGLRSYSPSKKIISQYPLSKYYYISRVIHDLFIKITKTKFERNSKFVQFFFNSINSNFGNFSQLKFKVLEKK